MFENDAKVIVHLDTQDDDAIEAVRYAIDAMLNLQSISFITTTDNPCDEVRD